MNKENEWDENWKEKSKERNEREIEWKDKRITKDIERGRKVKGKRGRHRKERR